MPHYTVGLSVIARNEAACIARLLHSVRPHVDSMLVLDTGSQDETAAMARACGARVEHFTWCQDFAAARNAALDLQDTDWHLVMDADEWLMDGALGLQQLRQSRPAFVGALQLIDHTGSDTADRVVSWISRILPGPTRYAGRVHEQPQHTLAVQRLSVRIGHDGYSAANLQAKRGRNRALLHQDLALNPADAYLWYQLGKDCGVYAEHGLAADAFAKAAALAPAQVPWRTDMAARYLYALKMCARHADGLQFAQASLASCAESPDFFFALGDLLLDWAATDPARGDELLGMAQASWTHCLELGERPDLTGSVMGRGSHLAAHNLAVVLECLGQQAQAALLRQRYPPPAPGGVPGTVSAAVSGKAFSAVS